MARPCLLRSACHPGVTPVQAVYLLHGISGLVSLGCQVAWFRIFVDWIGSANLASVSVPVPCIFIGGLGFQLQISAPRPVVQTSVLVAGIPTLAVFILCQRVIIRGIVVPVEK